MGGQSIIRRADIVEQLVERDDLGTAAYKDESYFAKSSDIPSPSPTPTTVKVFKNDVVWVDDYVKISTTVAVSSRKIEITSLTIQLADGVKSLGAIVAYPRAETYNGSVPNEFYIKDVDAIISKTTNFDYIELKYFILTVTNDGTYPKYDVRSTIGENVIHDEDSSSSSHSSAMKACFLAMYPDLWSEFGIEAVESMRTPMFGNTSVKASFEPKACELIKANMLFRPYVGGATSEQSGSSPGILKVAAHYGNYSQLGGVFERNITSADDVFLTNVIAVAARTDDATGVMEYEPVGRGSSSVLGRYGWTKTGWTGSYADGFTHTAGVGENVLQRFSNLEYATPEGYYKYHIDFIVIGRTTGSFIIECGGFTSGSFTASGRFTIISNSNTPNNEFIRLVATSDFDGTVKLDAFQVHYNSSYGRGLEFFEDLNDGETVKQPVSDAWVAFAQVCTNEAGTIIQATLDVNGKPIHPDFTDTLNSGDTVELRYAPSPITVVIDEILSTGSFSIVTPITPIPNASNNPYVWKFCTGRTIRDIGGIGYRQQQSPVCSLVGAKLKKIKLLSGANWQIVREAARMTAKKTIGGVYAHHTDSGKPHWDKYRGFGCINPDNAIQWIKDNYTENASYIDFLKANVERAHGINAMLTYEDITDNTPITKKMLEEKLNEILELLNE